MSALCRFRHHSWLGLVFAFIFLFAAVRRTHAQEPQPGATAVTGRVTDTETGRPLAHVLVEVEGLGLRTFSDTAGLYRLQTVPAGPQVLRARLIGYASARLPVTVPTSGVLTLDIKLAVSALEIPGIVVTADPVGRAAGELGTASVIGQEAVAHLPSTSLADILGLVPGISMSPPGLESGQQVALRSAATTSAESRSLAAFGTAIILDGVPISNNANLQSAPAGVVGLLGQASGGVDLSRLPASTIQRVEVIRGVPSARYGDLTQGAVVVETRAGVVDPNVGIQFDSRTLNGSVVSGWEFLANQTGTVAFDITRYAVSPGVTDDAAYRLSLQLAHRGEWGPENTEGEGRVQVDTRLDAFDLREDRAIREEEPSQYTSWTRNTGIRLSNRTRLNLGTSAHLLLTLSGERTSQRSYMQELKASGAIPFTDRLTEGRSYGRYIAGSYLTQLRLDGEPWLLFGRLEGEIKRRGLGLDHLIRVGAEARREWNAGPGYQFDIDRPPEVSFDGVSGFSRPRPFDEIPALTTTSFYIDDLLNRSLPNDMRLRIQAGMRVDLLYGAGPGESGVRDAAAQPRLNAELLVNPWLALRAGWGQVAKVPSLGSLYPAPTFYDLVNVNWYSDDPAERLAVLTTFIEDPTNPDLGFSVATKAEAGLELGLGGSAISFVAYREQVRDAVGLRPEPGFLLRDQYELDASQPGQPPTLLEPPVGADTIPILTERPVNNTRLTTRGVEIVALFPEIRPLRTRIQLQAAWTETEQEKSDLDFGGRLAFQDFQLTPARSRVPYWEAPVRKGRSVLANYRLIHQQPELGLVITAWFQHNISDRVWDVAGTDTLAFAGYMTRGAQLVPVPSERRGDPEYAVLRRTRSGLVVDIRSTPADWMMGIEVSKTLPLESRLSFWAFNALDRRGYYIEPDVYPRTYSSRRFGLEVSMPIRPLFGGGQ
jgi:outer membrane receptor protein involved in Fe transport